MMEISNGCDQVLFLTNIEKIVFQRETRLNMLFTPMLPVKAEFSAILRILRYFMNAEICWDC